MPMHSIVNLMQNFAPFSAICRVLRPPMSWTPIVRKTAENGANGTIVPVGDSVLNHGETIVYTVTPDDCYYISEVLVDEADVLGDDSTTFTYTFADVQEPHTIVANFAIYEYEMAETHTGNGTVTTATVNCGDTYTYTITARMR